MTATALLVDTNLLLLYVVGTTSRALVSRHKRTRTFTADDYDVLIELIDAAPRVLVTPNTLTETSNLAVQGAGGFRDGVMRVLGMLIVNCDEIFVPSRSAGARFEFHRLGLTDCVLLEANIAGATLLTADLHLYLAALNANRPALNFHHFRNV